MRKLILAAGVMLLGATAFLGTTPAQADPYRWCAEYGGRQGGGTNCYFMTLNQCQAAISGMGGFCRRNQFYDGRPQRTPETYGFGGGERRQRNWDRY